MLFSIEEDTGDYVTCYLVPDAFSAVPTIRVMSAGEELLLLEANETRDALVIARRHESGQCGFSFDAQQIPGLKDIEDLEIYDAKSGVLVYRRPSMSDIQKKVIRIETHLFPLWQFDEALQPRFQYFAKGIESLGSETTTQLFLLNKVNSVYLSGRILYKNYAYYIEAGFETIVILQDPYEELAERLFVLSKMRQFGSEHFGLRNGIGMQDAMMFAEAIVANNDVMSDDKALRRLLRNMPRQVAAVLSNPLVRELTAGTPDEMPGRNAVATSLDLLSGAAVIGLRPDPDMFIDAVSEFLKIDRASLPAVPRFAKVPAFGDTLRKTGEVDILIEKDLEVYHYVREAARKVESVLIDQGAEGGGDR